MNGWVRPSVCLSHLFDYAPIIVSSCNFQELLPMTEVTSMQKVKVTEVNYQLIRFWTVTPVSIHPWLWNDAQSLLWYRQLGIEQVPYCFPRSSIKFQGHTGQKIVNFGHKLSKITSSLAAVKSLWFALFILIPCGPPKIGQNYCPWSFSQNFPLVSHQSWLTCQLELPSSP